MRGPFQLVLPAFPLNEIFTITFTHTVCLTAALGGEELRPEESKVTNTQAPPPVPFLRVSSSKSLPFFSAFLLVKFHTDHKAVLIVPIRFLVLPQSCGTVTALKSQPAPLVH